MALSGITPSIAIRSSSGVEVWKSTGFKEPYVPDENFARDESKISRAIVYSPEGRFLAWANNSKVQICTVNDWKIVCTLPRPKAFYLKFSPKGTYLMTWEIYTTNSKEDVKPNLYLYKCETGEEVFSVIQKRQTDWECHWASDESMFALMIGGEVLFYEIKGDQGFDKPVKKMGGGRNGGISLSPSNCPPFVAFYVPGTKGAPSMCKLYRYPNVEANQPVAMKSFFQADKVDMMWNQKGNGLLLLTSTDVDQSGVSYYGKQALHYMTTKGDSYAVQLSAEGPIHAVAWNPKSTDFCVVYGYMPSKATLFNLKCDQIFDFGTEHRNSLYYNDFGNLLLFGGFGNLPGHVEVWDMTKKKQIATNRAPDTTYLEWCPTGEIFMTATTAPRLRMSNGFKIWHYSGSILHETDWVEKQELLEVTWQRYPKGAIKENTISDTKVEGIVSTTPQASKQKYVPPCARGADGTPLRPGTAPGASRPPIPGLPPGYRPTTAQHKNRRNNRKVDNREKEKDKDKETTDTSNGNTNEKEQNAENNSNNKKDSSSRLNRNDNRRPKTASDLPEREKKIRGISKKLREIKSLKERSEKGETLESAQVIKVNLEEELVKELRALRTS